ncbi:MAG: methyltransferase domain-containing protein [Xanthobacteraceae bacterium]|nr:methyltransferase domain-containing protein [Xanthobacteraceae bacterium]
MGFYQDRILPHLINLAMRQRNLAIYRQRLMPAARGRVLEVGIGSGFNLPYYTANVERVVGLDPSPKLLEMTRGAAGRVRIPVDLIESSAESIPLDSGSIDTIVTTWTMCSIPDIQRALDEMRRVLRPGGRLLFVEHGRSPDLGVRRWQDALTPAWRRISGGCHLNRAISELIETAGFRVERLETGYTQGPRPMTFMYEGSAEPR